MLVMRTVAAVTITAVAAIPVIRAAAVATDVAITEFG